MTCTDTSRIIIYYIITYTRRTRWARGSCCSDGVNVYSLVPIYIFFRRVWLKRYLIMSKKYSWYRHHVKTRRVHGYVSWIVLVGSGGFVFFFENSNNKYYTMNNNNNIIKTLLYCYLSMDYFDYPGVTC